MRARAGDERWRRRARDRDAWRRCARLRTRRRWCARAQHRASGRGRRSAAATGTGGEGDGRTTLRSPASCERAARGVREHCAARSPRRSPCSSCAQRQPLRRRGDVSRDAGARQRGGATNDLVVCPLLRRPAQQRAAGARSCAAASGCRAIEPPAHRLAGASIARPASRPAQTLTSSSVIRRGRTRSSARRFGARGCRWCSGCTLPVTAGTGSSGGRGI